MGSYAKIFEDLQMVDEELDSISNKESDENDFEVKTSASGDNSDIMQELESIITPLLIKQSFDNQSSDMVQESLSNVGLLNERTIVQFDDTDKISQMMGICSMLLARKNKDEKFKSFVQAKKLAKKLELEIQKDNQDDAQTLLQKFLLATSTSNSSSIARDEAGRLLPKTQF